MPDPAALPVAFRGRDGVALRGDAWGDPEARVALLLHGGGQTRHSWAGTGVRLGRAGFRAVSLDLRGHGESGWSPGGAYGIEDFVGDLVAVARSLPAPPAVVGASLGGMTALLAEGEAEASLLSALVLVDVTPRLETAGVTRIIDFMTSRPEGFESLDEAADAVAAYRRHRSRPRDLSGLAKNLRRGSDGRWRWHWDPAFMRRHPASDGERDARHVYSQDRMLDAARRLRIPTLLVRGRESDVVSADGVAEFRAAAPHAHYVDVSEAGHMVAGDRNDAFSEVVVAFLSESRPASP
jgi:non-heme chloroperoxidase